MINNGEDSRVIRLNPVSVVVLAFTAFLSCLANAQTDRFFPESTKGFVSITNLKDFVDKLDKTSIGDLRRTPEAKEFFESFIKEVKKRIQMKSTNLLFWTTAHPSWTWTSDRFSKRPWHHW